MPRYLTGLVTTDYWRSQRFPYKSRDWRLEFTETDVSRNHREERLNLKHKPIIGKEVLINARTEVVAQRAAFLLQGSLDLLDGHSIFSQMGGTLEILDAKRASSADRKHRASRSQSNIPLACKVAARIGTKRRWIYSLSKLWLSYQNISIAGVDLDPTHSENIPKSTHPRDHVAYANAIQLAYAAIEELGLEIRANADKPSTLNGKWNPPVKEDLESRLCAGGVNLDDPFYWNLRGPKTILDNRYPPRITSLAPWARHQVRDGVLEVADAIAHVSWLRSKVATHRLKYEFVKVLSVYEVANSQHLASRLLLESLGQWRKWD
jgi:hypothetical protein